MPETFAFETPGAVSLTVRGRSGDVTVDPILVGSTEVDVIALNDSDQTLAAVAGTRVDHAERSGGHAITVTVPDVRGRLGRGPQVAIAIRCPERTDADISTSSGDVELRGHVGRVIAKTRSGDGRVETAAELRWASASGDLDAREVEGELQAQTASGDVEIGVTRGRVRLHVVSGDVNVREAHKGVDAQAVSGDVTVQSLLGDANVQAVSGDVELALVPGQRLWLDVSSVSGDVRSSLDADGAGATGDEGDATQVKVRTVSGDVTLARAPAVAPPQSSSDSASASNAVA